MIYERFGENSCALANRISKFIIHYILPSVMNNVFQTFFQKDVKECDLDITPDVSCKPSEAVTRMRRGSGPLHRIQKSCVRDVEALLDHDIKCNNQNKTRQQFQRSLSTDNLYKPLSSDTPAVGSTAAVPPQLSLPPVTQLDSATDYLSNAPPMTNQNVERSSQKQSRSLMTSDLCTFIAVNDYNPELFSTSGQKELELPLHEGDLVKVIGELFLCNTFRTIINHIFSYDFLTKYIIFCLE